MEPSRADYQIPIAARQTGFRRPPVEATKSIAEIVRDLYDNLAKSDGRLAVHLRVAKNFTPPALQLLTDILEKMRGTLASSAAE